MSEPDAEAAATGSSNALASKLPAAFGLPIVFGMVTSLTTGSGHADQGEWSVDRLPGEGQGQDLAGLRYKISRLIGALSRRKLFGHVLMLPVLCPMLLGGEDIGRSFSAQWKSHG